MSDYWLRFEWQHRGSPHVHCLAWLPNAPNVEHYVEHLFTCPLTSTTDKNDFIAYINSLVNATNLSLPPDAIDYSNH